MNKLVWFFLVLLITGGLAQGSNPTYTLRYNHVLAPTHPFHAAFQKWAQRVAARTKGDLQILVGVTQLPSSPLLGYPFLQSTQTKRD